MVTELRFSPMKSQPPGPGDAEATPQAETRPRVLLTNACGPYPTEWGTAPSDLLGARLARGHTMLQESSRLPTWALYLLAENISNPSTVLEFPDIDAFQAEVDKKYEYIAIQLMSLHTARVAEMMRLIRERSPETQIVIGGYGVATLKQGLPGDTAGDAQYILDNADHICRKEGVRFMRKLLDDGPIDRPVTQYRMPPATVNPFSMKSIQIELPAISVALGCPAACDFCNTSAFFRHKKLRVASPAQVYDFMKHHQKQLGRDRITFILFDEDIFLDAPYVRELGRLIRSDESTWGFRWISFGSMGALQSFTARELRECGVEGIWIGVESGLAEESGDDALYDKRASTMKAPELFASLRENGIMTIGSMILGFDFHTRENIERDIDYFVNLRPTLYQIGPIRPCPGTKLYNIMRKGERINDHYNWQDFHLWREGSHNLENFEDGEIRKYYDLAHDRLKEVNGSPVLQIFEANMLAYQSFRDADSEFLRFQAHTSYEAMRALLPVVWAMQLRPESDIVRDRIGRLRKKAERHLRGDSVLQKGFRLVASRVIAGRLAWPKRSVTPDGYTPESAITHYTQTVPDVAETPTAEGFVVRQWLHERKAQIEQVVEPESTAPARDEAAASGGAAAPHASNPLAAPPPPPAE